VRNFLKNFRFVLFLLASLLVHCSAEEPGLLPARKLVIQRDGGEPVAMRVEVARTDSERAQGLMFRKKLEDGKGMLFVFENEERLSFWMKNTYIPLSVAFISAGGRITEIRDMEPLDLSSVHSTFAVRYALEVPKGWFSRAGIAAGDRLLLD
jgi:uncharacterized membrane protein (UPF0127 family)